MRQPNQQAGFTLIEIMIVVAIVAILAAVVVPSFFREASKSKADSEVSAIFAELSTRQEAFRIESPNSEYMSTGTDTSLFPSTPNPKGQPVGTLPTSWTTLRVAVQTGTIYCSYASVAGLAGDGTNIGSVATSFGFTAPTMSWYYNVARCNMDGNTAVDSYYFQSSTNVSIQKQNHGR